ncbi:MAG: hypothetical protein H6748_03460 [Spirochaetaceae bacterium]|nr:hypothetical protein [Myxococcales bacterium]MCB9723087.1 hypothetical protein [Spirochaetaceae bacterium]
MTLRDAFGPFLRRPGRALALMLVFGLLGTGPASAADRDADGVDDAYDNCLWTPNADQRDADEDGFGNRCDADLDGDGFVTGSDFALFASAFGRPDPVADFDGDGWVWGPDFAYFVEAFGGTPGPGALAPVVADYTCDGTGACSVSVLPGIRVVADRDGIERLADGRLRVTGDVEIPTPSSSVILAEAELVIEPGVSMQGHSLEPDYRIGSLAGAPSLLFPQQVEVSTALGRELVLEIPLLEDVHYVVFSSGRLIEAQLGALRVVAPSSGWRLVLDPSDPFVYAAGSHALPIVLGGGLEIQEVGQGIGVSLQGRAPFAIDVPEAISEVLPEIHGDSVSYVAGSLSPFPISFAGFGVFEHDPDGDGDPVLGGDVEHGADYRFGLDGTIGLEFGLLLPGLSLEVGELSGSVIASHTGARSARPRREVWVSGRLPQPEDLNGLISAFVGVPSGRHAFVAHFDDDASRNFFRSAIELPVALDTRRMGALHGVGLETSTVASSVLHVDARAFELRGERETVALHPDVRFLETQRTRLTLPWSDDEAFELRIDSRAELGGIELREYGIRLTTDVFQHWGRYETARYVYGLAGEYGVNGPWLEGTVEVALPYRYPAVDLAADVAGRIAAQEQVVAALESDYALDLRTLGDLEAALRGASDGLDAARSALSSARARLRDAQNALAQHDAYSCGTCAWYDAPCWAAVGVCEGWKIARRPVLVGAVEIAEQGVTLAQAGVTAAQAAVQRAELQVIAARSALELLVASLDEAAAALVALRAERARLPEQDGVIAAVVSLRVSRDGLGGRVTGTFEGVDFGEGRVVNDAAGPRACFVVPQTGEELCTAL